MDWRIDRPLAGRCIAVTRPVSQAAGLRSQLEAAGAMVLHYPAMAIAPPDDVAALDAALRQASAYDWMVLTSANTVSALAARLDAQGWSPAILHGPQIAAVGPATANAVRRLLHVTLDVMPTEYSARHLAAVLGALDRHRVWLPQSMLAGEDLAEALRQQGATVDVTPAYHMVRGCGGDDLPGALRRGAVDAVTFTSPSTVDFTVQRLDVEAGLGLALLNGILLACIGPSTARAVAAHGLHAALVAQAATETGLIEALCQATFT